MLACSIDSVYNTIRKTTPKKINFIWVYEIEFTIEYFTVIFTEKSEVPNLFCAKVIM